MHIGVLGGGGMLGGDLVKFLSENFSVDSIDRKNYEEYRGREYDVFINANGNSKRFWANEHPFEDFEASTISVARSLFDFHYKKYIYISTPDIYEDPTSPTTTHEDSPGLIGALLPYGFHKRLSEDLVRRYAKDFIILRSAAILGTKLKKGIAYDILVGNELFVTLDSKIQFISTKAVSDIITTLLSKNESCNIFNVGGRGAVTPEAIGSIAGRRVRVRSDAKTQQYEMNIDKIAGIYDALETSEDYVRFLVQTWRVM